MQIQDLVVLAIWAAGVLGIGIGTAGIAYYAMAFVRLRRVRHGARPGG
jgi:hypothetical protein